jgi:integrase
MGHRRLPGLGNHRGKDGQIYWFTDTHVGGRPPKGKKIFESWGAITREEAEERHKELLDLTWRRVRGFRPSIEEPVSFTFAEATTRYLRALESAGRDAGTIKEYRTCLERAGSYLPIKPMSEIRIEDIEAMRARIKNGRGPNDEILERTLAFRTRRNVERTCSMLFKFARRRGWTTHNPLEAFVFDKPPKDYRKKSRFRRLHPCEDQKLLDACGASWHRAAAAIGLYLGVRVTPVASLRLTDIDFFSEVICVPCEFNKGHARDARDDLWVPIPRHTMSFLREQYGYATKVGSPWLFPTGVVKGRRAASGHLHPQQVTEGLQKAASRIGHGDATFHALRAICNNRLRASGVSSAISGAAASTRAVLGHSNEEAARPYLDAVVEYLRPVFDAYDDWLDKMSIAPANLLEMRVRK